MQVGFVGLGCVGASLARGFAMNGIAVGAVMSRTQDDAWLIADEIGAVCVKRAVDVVHQCDLTFLTVPDDVIAEVAAQIAVDGGVDGRWIVHTSGAHSADVLKPLRDVGSVVGSLHPAFPFSDHHVELERLHGVTFAVEAEDQGLRDVLREIVGVFGGQVLGISATQKPLYHAALVMASNYTVTLYALAERLLEGVGADEAAQKGALDALVGATWENIREKGAAAALTGPLVRGDVGTVRAHLHALDDVEPLIGRVYRALGEGTLPIVAACGMHPDDIDELKTELRQHSDDSTGA